MQADTNPPSKAPAKPMSAGISLRASAAIAVESFAPVTKQVRIIVLLRRPIGATIADMMEVTGWLPHSVRGALSGVPRRKLGLVVQSEAEAERGRVYRLGGDPAALPSAVQAPAKRRRPVNGTGSEA